MKKTLTILLILVLPFFITACIKKPADKNAGVKQNDTQKQEKKMDTGKTTGNLFDLVTAGIPQHCTGSFESEGVMFDMEVYTSGKKFYTTQTINAEEMDQELTAYSIYDGEWYYTWGDLFGMASKIKMEEFEKTMEEFTEYEGYEKSDEVRQNAMDFQKQMNYNCKAWVPEESKFKPPMGIDFIDYSEELSGQMEQVKEFMDSGAMEEMTQDVCEQCETLPSQEMIDSCKESVGC